MSDDEKEQPRSRSKTPIRTFRSTNPYINFIQEFRKDEENLNTSGKEIFRRAGDRWNKMTDEEKAPYRNAAKITKGLRDSEPTKPLKKTKPGKKKGKKPKGDRNDPKGGKGKKNSVPNSICSRCGHRHGGVRLRKRDSLEQIMQRKQRDDGGGSSTSTAATSEYLSSTSTASF